MLKPKRRFVIPALVLAVTFALFRFVLFIGYVPTESMEPTLKKGSVIIGSRLLGELEVGDIIVFWHEGKLLIKRIAAVSGDTVWHWGKKLTVPERCFYVLGDNAENSYDSRLWLKPFIGYSAIISRSFPRPATGLCN